MPLMKNVPDPNNKKWAKQVGIAEQVACTECALKECSK